MTEKSGARAAQFMVLALSGVLASGCMSSPKYGTDKTANEQLLGDLSGIVSLKPKTNPVGEYKPRPELVKPASTAELPVPQDNIVTASQDAWPESPEQKRARIRDRATQNRDKAGFEAEVVNDVSVASATSKPKVLGVSDHSADAGIINAREAAKQRDEFNKRMAETKQGSSASRKFLSEPPLAYRQPAETAAVGDVGEDELKKQRRIKKQAQKKGTGGWRDLVPWL